MRYRSAKDSPSEALPARWLAAFGLFSLTAIVAAPRASATDVRLVGPVAASPGFTIGQVTLQASEVANFDFFTSGTLRLEYWFFSTPYSGYPQFGYKVAQATLGQLYPGYSFFNVSQTVPIIPPPDGYYCPAFVLTEFTGFEYTPRDWSNFTCRYVGDPPNSPPNAYFTVSSSSGVPPLTVVLDASGSSDSDGFIVGYGWSASDGQTRSGAVTSMTFWTPGTYTITLAVTDNDGAADFFERTVTVVNLPDTCIRESIQLYETLSRTLSTSDCAVDVDGGRYYTDLYEIVLPYAGRLWLAMNSTQLDAYLGIFTPDGDFLLAEDDDSGGGLNALLAADLAAGTYLITATSYDPDEIGTYSLYAVLVPEPPGMALGGVALAAVVAIAGRRRRAAAKRTV